MIEVFFKLKNIGLNFLKAFEKLTLVREKSTYNGVQASAVLNFFSAKTHFLDQQFQEITKKNVY